MRPSSESGPAPIDLGTYCSPGDVLRRVLSERDYAHMEPCTGGQRKFGKRLVVGQGVTGRISRVIEQQEETVGAPDLADVVDCEERAGPAVVRSPDLRRAGVAEVLDQTCAVDYVGEE